MYLKNLLYIQISKQNYCPYFTNSSRVAKEFIYKHKIKIKQEKWQNRMEQNSEKNQQQI